MAYTINRTDGTVLTTLIDGTTNTDTGLTLIGRNYITYGEVQNENFIRLLENFSSSIPPGQSVGFAPISGQLWWDSTNRKLKAFNGVDFVPVSEMSVGATAPVNGIKTGDQWWDTANSQLKIYNGTTWLLIGPSYTSAQGKSGTFTESVTDSNSQTHTVVNTYTNGNLISVASFDREFTPPPTYPYTLLYYPTVRPGINLASNVTLNGNVENSFRLGGLFANAYARIDTPATFSGDLSVNGNLRFSGANVGYRDSRLTISNEQLSGNVDFFVKTTTGNVNALNIDGSSGLVRVAGVPTHSHGIANKSYVDGVASNILAIIGISDSTQTGNIDQLRNDYFANITQVIHTQNANLAAVQSSINTNVATLNTALNSNVARIDANVANNTSAIGSLNSNVALRAPLNSPNFSGSPTAPQVSALLNEITRINSLTYYIALNNTVTVANGQYIIQRDPVSTAIISNVQAIESVTASNIRVKPVSGTVSTGVTSMFVNNVFTLGLQATGYGSLSTALQYPGLGDRSQSIATTLYVDVTANLLYGELNSRLENETANRISAINSAVATKANIESPAFTGTPTTTVPSSGDNSSRIATTSFVRGAIETQKFRYTVSSSGPSGGSDGDFWFQIG